MKRATDSIMGFALYTVFIVVTTLLVFVACLFWYMSPLGLGFAQWPTNADQRLWADIAYRMSYFIGIPLLVLGQVVSAILEAKGRRRLAYIIPSTTILFFIANVSIVLLLLEP